MITARATGRGSAARKYDLLSVLGAHGLASGKAGQRIALRLICLITTRYNWQTDELSVGQAEIAQLWSVDLRTVKRELALLRGRGWLIEKRPAARGRVTVYGLGQDRILQDTRPGWGNIGSDLEARLSSDPEPVPTNILRFPQSSDDGLWGRVQQLLRDEQPTVFAAWIAALSADSLGPEVVSLRAPSGFHATYVRSHLAPVILAAVQRCGVAARSLQVS